ncbi:hypothetical protein P171DRAFT_39716 [Karstenula rhodostoma CBS 690.94]|uniref:Uncharacterized protein n=1 Tax=Karstenula rhodostoma CBS 690.94 TaxID=1392251 RepID=A0A9P4PEF0_9PLEO|nr:hypothetical protein P171DRAFT_39716 [Karstenula rhodostoma CBS 690.94]
MPTPTTNNCQRRSAYNTFQRSDVAALTTPVSLIFYLNAHAPISVVYIHTARVNKQHGPTPTTTAARDMRGYSRNVYPAMRIATCDTRHKRRDRLVIGCRRAGGVSRVALLRNGCSFAWRDNRLGRVDVRCPLYLMRLLLYAAGPSSPFGVGEWGRCVRWRSEGVLRG